MTSFLDEFFKKDGLLSSRLGNYESREGQQKMAEAILKSFKENSKLLVEAGTGIGKSFAYLIPAFYSGEKVLISTYTKNLQDQLVRKDIPFVESLFDKKIKVVLMKGRSNYICRRRFARYLNDTTLFDRMSTHRDQLRDWVASTDTGDISEFGLISEKDSIWDKIISKKELTLGRHCEYYDRCFYNRISKRGYDADILVVNHALFFTNESIRYYNLTNVLDDDYNLDSSYETKKVIFDEAHQLESVAAVHYGERVTDYQIIEIVKDTKEELLKMDIASSGSDLVLNGIEKAIHSTFSLVRTDKLGERESIDDDLRSLISSQASEFVALLKDASKFFEGLNGGGENKGLGISERFSAYAERLEKFIRFDIEEAVYYRISHHRSVELHRVPIDVSSLLKSSLYPYLGSVVFTSATLAVDDSFDFVKNALGLTDIDELKIESPFDYKKQAVVYINKWLTEPDNPSYISNLAKEIKRLIKLTYGRTFVLFTNNKTMEAVYSKLLNSCDNTEFNFMIQGDFSKYELVERFRSTERSVLFGVSSFWQGVDIQGSSLSSVIITKLPFPPFTDPVISAKMLMFKKNGESSFFNFQIPSTFLLLKQGVGRLIRSKTDKGLIAILDSRVATKGYGKVLLKALPDCRIIYSFDKLSEQFDRLNIG